MFNVGGGEVVVLLLLALLLLGPEKLPEASRKIGRILAEIRRVTSGFEEEVRSAMDMGPGAKVVDLLDSTTEGPTLTGPVVVSDPSTGPTPGGTPAAFVADLAPTRPVEASDDPAEGAPDADRTA